MEHKRTLIGDLSASRAFLQGAAMLWVIAFHLLPSLSILGGGRRDILLRAVFGSGYGGCDVFLLLSGFGLARSLKRDSNVLRFYGRRIQKLWPAYYLFMILFLAVLKAQGGLTMEAVVGNLTFAGFWMRWFNQFNWYVQAMMVFYLIAPLLHWNFEFCSRRWMALGKLLLLSAVMQYFWWGRYQMMAITRLPIFVLGFWLGRHENRELPWRWWYPVGGLAACALGGWLLAWVQPYAEQGNGLFWYPFLLIAPGLCLLGAWIRPFLLKIPGYSWVDRGICLLGACSFEIYLLQSLLIEWIKPPLQGKLQWYLLGAGAIVMGIGYHYALECAGKRMKKLRKQ